MSDILSIGKSGLFASKQSLETTGHNIANANTEGYSRQRVIQTTNVPVVSYGNTEGTGVRTLGNTRIHDEFVEKRLNSHISQHEFAKERTNRLEQIENIFNETDNEGLNNVMNRFYNSFRDLANQPENEAVRSVVRDTATLIIKDVHRIRETLDGISSTIDRNLQKNVTDINSSINRVCQLNKEIAKLENIGGQSGDLRDQRDAAIRTLSEFFDISSYQDNNGAYVVAAKNVGTLVAGGAAQELSIGPVEAEKAGNNMPGSVEIYFKDRTGEPISKSFKGGTLSSIIQVRNDDIKKLRDNIDSLTFEFANSVNALHRRGFVNRQIEVSPNGDPVKFDTKGATTNIDFFKIGASSTNSAQTFDLSDEVKSDLNNIATALLPNASGDNRVALAISKLQHEKILGDGTRTLEEQYLQTIGSIGLETGKARLDAQQSEGILAQTKQMKERISGVSIDEEAANLMKYQHAYDASAKVLKASDEMFKTVLAIKN